MASQAAPAALRLHLALFYVFGAFRPAPMKTTCRILWGIRSADSDWADKCDV